MIRITKLVVHCEQDNLTVDSIETLWALKRALSAQLEIPTSHIIFNYEQIEEKNENKSS